MSDSGREYASYARDWADSSYLDSLALYLGLVCVGTAMAFAVSLALIQDAAIAAGTLPEPGTSAEIITKSPMWSATKTLRKLANGTGVLGSVLLLTSAWRELQTEEAQEGQKW